MNTRPESERCGGAARSVAHKFEMAVNKSTRGNARRHPTVPEDENRSRDDWKSLFWLRGDVAQFALGCGAENWDQAPVAHFDQNPFACLKIKAHVSNEIAMDD
jgi:hypothetical protein